jgi:succinyl-CoA synthetase alpha subunit
VTQYVEVRPGTYRDSVSLMQVSRAVQQSPGVSAALVAMATELNLGLLAEMGLPAPDGAGPNDLLVAVRADGDEALAAALGTLEAALLALSQKGPGAGGLGAHPASRTTGSAARRSPATLALVSVPGPYAFVEALDALEAGLHVMVFSDNVPVEQEVRLKDEAARRGLLVMGPDCGTAAVGGVGLGFANVVRPGRVGLVAASGTGAQQLMCLLDAAGVGTSACLGVGGRDLSAAVAGRSTRQALAALDADAGTDLVVVVSKPPAPEVAAQVRDLAAGLRTPVRFALLGEGSDDLTAVAEDVVRRLGAAVPAWPVWHPDQEPAVLPPGSALRGLFSGGTLCDEAMVLAAAALGPVASNTPLRPEWALPADLAATGHAMIDFGDDRLTSGRPHPMIDPTLRLERLAREAADPTVGVVLLDVVLGHGADPDPAASLAPAVRAARATARADGRELAVVVSLCGTAGDPQGRERQAQALSGAGATVLLSNAAAARHAVRLVRSQVTA